MLKTRLITALILIPFVIIALFFLSLPFYAAAIILICGLGFWEWGQFLGFKQFGRMSLAVVSILVLAMIYYLLPARGLAIIFQIALVGSLLWWVIAFFLVISYPKSAHYWQHSLPIKLLAAIFTLLPFFVGMITLRQLDYTVSPYKGAFWVLYVCVLVWAADSGAYFVGRLWGKKKLAPAVSPGKTFEGFIGGVLTAFVIALVINLFWPLTSAFSLFHLLLCSVSAIFVSVLGDLTESMFKREAKIKDSSQLLPGHGGVLDRIDSLTAAIPVFIAVLLHLS